MKTTIKLTLGFLLASSAMAQADGIVQVYNWGGYTSPEMLAKFEAETGIKAVVTDYDSSDTALARVRQGGHGFDVVIVASSALPIWVAEGLLQPLDPAIVTDRANIAADWQNVGFDPGREYTVPWAFGSTGIVVNTEVFGGDINTADIIFNPPAELLGRINVSPEMSDVMALAIYHAGGDDACTTDLEILRRVRDTLMAAKPKWAAMNYGSADSYASGDLAAGIYWNGAALNLRGRAPQFAFGYPVTGYPLWMDNAGVLAEAANRDAAMRFVNFLLQPENAALNSNYTRYANGIAGSEDHMDPVMISAPEIVPPTELAIAGRFTPTCSQDANDLHSRIWAELLQ